MVDYDTMADQIEDLMIERSALLDRLRDRDNRIVELLAQLQKAMHKLDEVSRGIQS